MDNIRSFNSPMYQNLWDDPYKLTGDEIEEKNEDYSAFDSFRDDELYDERDCLDDGYSIFSYPEHPYYHDIPNSKEYISDPFYLGKEYRQYDTDDLPVNMNRSVNMASNNTFDTDIPLANIGGITSDIINIDRIAKKGLQGYEDTPLSNILFNHPGEKGLPSWSRHYLTGDPRYIDLSEGTRFIDGTGVDKFKKNFTELYPSAKEYLDINNLDIKANREKQSIYNNDAFFQYYPKFDKLCDSDAQLYSVMDDCMVIVSTGNGGKVKGFNRHLCKFAEDIIQGTGKYGTDESILMGMLHTPEGNLDIEALMQAKESFKQGKSVPDIISDFCQI